MTYLHHLTGYCLLAVLMLNYPVAAQNRVDFGQAYGYGTSPEAFEIKGVRVDSRVTTDNGSIQTVTTYYNVSFSYDPETLQLVPVMFTEACADLVITVIDASTKQPLPGTETLLQQTPLSTNADGQATFSRLPREEVLLRIHRVDYLPFEKNLNLTCEQRNELTVELALIPEEPAKPAPTTQPDKPVNVPDTGIPGTDNGGEIPTPPAKVPPPKSVQITLGWGDNPRDLDPHLTGPAPGAEPDYDNQADRFHIYFGSQSTDTAELEGKRNSNPEVLSIRAQKDTQQLRSGIYRFSVNHFTGTQSRQEGNIATSGARVTVNIEGRQPEIFTPPVIDNGILQGNRNDVWVVFEMKVQEDGSVQILPVQKYINIANPAEIL